MKLYSLFLILILYTNLNSQYKFKRNKEKKAYLTLGYNRASFDRSSITFEGEGYNFTVKNVKATDNPSGKLSLINPQYNIRVGYFVTRKIALSIGYNHMKYVLKNNQISRINGFIDSSASYRFARKYKGDQKLIDSNFLIYNQAGGLDYISFDFEFHSLFRRTRNRKVSLELFLGFGAGIITSRTNISLFNSKHNSLFKISGSGGSINIGTRLYFLRYLFIQAKGKTGLLFMPNIKTDKKSLDKVSQNLHFFSYSLQMGLIFPVSR